jgi:TrmH family RNA methyltransferase
VPPISYLSISSAQNPRYKQAVRLRQRRGRDKQERILVDGRRELHAALRGGVQVESVFAPQSMEGGALDQELRALLDECAAAGAEVLLTPPSLLERISYGGRVDQPVAVALPPQRRLSDLRLPGAPLVAVLESVEKPGNLGAIVRSADAAGVAAVLVADPATDLFNPNAIRASLGTLFTLPVYAVSTEDVTGWLAQQGIQACVTRVDAQATYDTYDFRQPTAIVLGSEAWGVSQHWKSSRQQAVRLPMHGHADSLNVSVAAAILFYEANRQRRQPGA